MNILLDAYFDHNFGDDLFISIVTRRYAEHRFFAFIGGCEASVCQWAGRFPNLVVLPKCPTLWQTGMFDAYLMIGGDVLPDGGDYTGSYERRLQFMRTVKACGGYVAMLGFNLYHQYSPKTEGDLREMLRLADDVVPRDRWSFEYLRGIANEPKIRLGADMAFCLPRPCGGKSAVGHRLGISVRKKLACAAETDQAYQQSMAGLADAYLERYADAEIVFLALSYGSSDDARTAAEIQNRMRQRDRTRIAAYCGDPESYIGEFEACHAIVATRFHAFVMAAMLRKPLVAVPYEVKVTHVLDEIGYDGPRIPYGEAPEDLCRIAEELDVPRYHMEKLEQYAARANTLFDGIDRWQKETAWRRVPDTGSKVIRDCGIKEQLAAEKKQMKEALEHETTLYLAEWHQRLYLETCLNQERTAWLAQQEQYQREQAELLDARKCLEQENEQLRQSVRDLQEKLCFAAENALQR